VTVLWHTPTQPRLRATVGTCQWAGQETASDGQVALGPYSASCFTDHQSRSAAREVRRRRFLAALGGMAAGPIASYAQGPGLPLIGYLGPEAPERFASRVNAFRDGLSETGYIEGRNVGIEFRWADGDYQKLPALAADLAARQVAVMVAPGGAPNALAAKLATTTIPIVFEMGGDPVALGIVPSLSQPGGNLTGVSSLSVEVGPKRLESLHEVIPTASVFAVAANPTSPTANSQLEILKRTADALGLRLHVLHASAEQEFEQLFTRSPELAAGGLVFTSDPAFAFRSQQLAALAIRHRVPAINRATSLLPAGL
jgi:ABC-type uncharacterized transport system substrate-binding protein